MLLPVAAKQWSDATADDSGVSRINLHAFKSVRAWLAVFHNPGRLRKCSSVISGGTGGSVESDISSADLSFVLWDSGGTVNRMEHDGHLISGTHPPLAYSTSLTSLRWKPTIAPQTMHSISHSTGGWIILAIR